MRLQEFHSFMEGVAPSLLKESYDNVGVMVGNSEQEVKKILVALDCTLAVIEEAKKEKADMIFTHHPLLFKKPSSISGDNLQGKKIMELIKNDISLYSSHTNLDIIKNGMNDVFVELLGFKNSVVVEKTSVKGYDGSGIGRLVELKQEITLGELIDKVKGAFNLDYLRFAGDRKTKLKKVALINGSGEDFFFLSKAMGADCIITGDTSYHLVSDFEEMGISIIDIGHFGSEWPIFVVIANRIAQELKKHGHGVEVVISKVVKDPYILG